jgi:fructose-bisphosphate aldolase class II
MPLVSLAPLIADARRRGYAIGSFSCLNLETAVGIVHAAEGMGAPAVVAFTAANATWMDLPALAAAVRTLAARATVPLTLHLDHARRMETVEAAMQAGFTSVMFDGHGLPWEEHCRLTRDLVRRAHDQGITVEAELTPIAAREDLESRPGPGSPPLTEPGQAAAFARDTGIDVLAVAIGNIHHQPAGAAVLDLDRLRAIAAASPCALSLHGGSGVDDETLRAAIGAGIVKVSYFTRMARSAVDAIRQETASDRADLAGIIQAAQTAFRRLTEDRLIALGCRVWG